MHVKYLCNNNNNNNNLCWTASSQRPAQWYAKCGDNAILALLSSNIAVEVILRNCFGQTSNMFVFLNRDDTWYVRHEGNG